MFNQIRPALVSTALFTVVTGLVFPFAVYGISQTALHFQANGSLLQKDGKTIGSAIIGQNFAKPIYFHPRPSAAGNGYDASASSGTNLGPTSSKLINGIPDDPKTKADESYAGVKQLAEGYRKENGLTADAPVPADAVTRSASGLDPEISPENAQLQAARVARSRNLPLSQVQGLVATYTQGRQFGILGEPRVNVLALNMALDGSK